MIFIWLILNFLTSAIVAENLILHQDLARQFIGPWTLVSCNNKNLSQLMKHYNLAFQTEQMDLKHKLIQRENVIWDFESCSSKWNTKLLKSIENVPISKLWIVIHKNEDTIFPTKLHQNIIHYSRKSTNCF